MVRLCSVDQGVLRDNRGSSRTLGAQLTGCLASSADQRSVPYNDEAAGSSPATPTLAAVRGLGVQPDGGELGAEGPGVVHPAVDSGGPPEREVLPDERARRPDSTGRAGLVGGADGRPAGAGTGDTVERPGRFPGDVHRALSRRPGSVRSLQATRHQHVHGGRDGGRGAARARPRVVP
jgi:hypothetical protein